MHKTQILYPEARGSVCCQHAISPLSHQCPELTEEPSSLFTEKENQFAGFPRPQFRKACKHVGPDFIPPIKQIALRICAESVLP